MFIPVCLGASAHKYWRIYWTAAATGYGGAQAGEIEFRATPGGADQCVGGTAIGSVEYPPYTFAKAFDGLYAAPSDSWSNGLTTAIGHWIGYNFSVPVVVSEFWFYPSTAVTAPSNPTGFALEYSDDGTTWVRVREYSPTFVNYVAQTFTV